MDRIPHPSRILKMADADMATMPTGIRAHEVFRYRHGPSSMHINLVMFDGGVQTWHIDECRDISGERNLLTVPNERVPIWKHW